MFKNEFQGGSFVEVFSAQGRDPISKWRLTGSQSAFRKIFDKDVKSYVYVLEGESTTTKMCIPKSEKDSLFLIQKYLILQVLIPLGHSFSFELGVTDLGNNKRRVFLSSSHRDITVTPLHARFPLSILRLGVWLNLCLDLNSLVGETFKGPPFKSIDSLTLSANCHIRKIFTMKTQPPDTTDDDEIYGCHSTTVADVEAIPKGMQFTTSNHQTQIINLTKLRQADIKAREAAGLPPPLTPGVSEIDSSISKQDEQPMHIAFGSKIVIPKHARKSSREGGSGSAGGRTSSHLYNRSSSISHIRSGSPLDLEASSNSLSSGRGRIQRSLSETSDLDQSKVQLGIEAMPTSIQPRPPRIGSGNKSRRRPLRMRGKTSANSRSAGSRTNSESDKLGDSTSSYGKPEGASTYRSEKDDKDSDSLSETISRSQSESSLKASGNENSLGESLNQLNLNDRQNETTEGKEKPNLMFTFASRPRSAPRSPRNRRKRYNGFPKSPVEDKPNIELSEPKDSLNLPIPRDRKESDKSEYEEDFFKDTSESSDDDVLQKLLKSSQASRSSSRGSKHSPCIPETSQTPHVLRTSIKSSLLKEIPSSVIASKNYDSKNYQSNASSWRNYQSEAGSSWRFDTSDSSGSLLDKSLNSSYGDDVPIIQRFTTTADDGDDGIENNDDGDSLTDDSDETCSTWKAPPPASTRYHRYQDEMKHPGPEPDMSATLPLDPRDYTDVFSPPIVMPSEKFTNGQSHPQLLVQLSPPRNAMPSYSCESEPSLVPQPTTTECELDLLYDPCLNCYFDPNYRRVPKVTPPESNDPRRLLIPKVMGAELLSELYDIASHMAVRTSRRRPFLASQSQFNAVYQNM